MFVLLAIAISLGLIIGVLLGGRPVALKSIRLRGTWVLLGSLVVALAPLFVDGLGRGSRQAIQIATNVGVLLFLAWNIAAERGGIRAGLGVLAVGWALNFAVIAVNGGMPLSLWAWSHSGQVGAPTPGEGGFFKIILAGPDTILRPLGDVVPVRMLSQVVSIGDLVLMAGIALVVAAGMRDRRPAAAE